MLGKEVKDETKEDELKKNKLGYFRYGTYSIEEVFKLVEGMLNEEEWFNEYIYESDTGKGNRGKKNRVKYGNEVFSLGGYRLLTFFKYGVNCVNCGVEGKFFSLDNTRLEDRKHLNLIGVKEDGTEVLMTSDHIYPKSLGGDNGIENRQTMCARCNSKKGNKV